MPSAKVDKAMVENVVSDLMLVIPLMKKKLLNLDDAKQKCGLPMTHTNPSLKRIHEAADFALSRCVQILQ